jgi:hypothetical protein
MTSPFTSSTPDPFQSPQTTSPPRRSWSLVWLLAAGAMAGFCCCGLCVVPSGMGIYQSVAERDDVELVVTQFLVAMDQQRVDEALSLFSKRAITSQAVTREQLDQLIASEHFEGCQSATIQQINVSRSFNTNRKVPQGVVANVSGPVSYRDGTSGAFRATLEKDGDHWRLFSIHIQRNENRKADPSPKKSDSNSSSET